MDAAVVETTVIGGTSKGLNVGAASSSSSSEGST